MAVGGSEGCAELPAVTRMAASGTCQGGGGRLTPPVGLGCLTPRALPFTWHGARLVL